MKEMWRSDSCYGNYGVDGSTCSFFIYLSEVSTNSRLNPSIFGVKLAVLNSSGRYSEVERPVTRERCPKNKIIREADGISYLMRANYSESRRAGTGEKGDDSVRTAGRCGGGRHGGTAVLLLLLRLNT